MSQTKTIINISFSASGIDLFQLCHARYNYGRNLRKALPIINKSQSLDLGALAHHGFETYFNGLRDGLDFNDRLHASIKKIQFVASDPSETNLEPGDELNWLITTFEQNCDYWRSEDEQMEVLATEAPFDYILYEDDEIRIIMSGKIDLLVNIHGIGRNASYTNLPFDHKTYKRDFPIYGLSNQFLNYVVAADSSFLIVNRVGLQTSLKPDEKYKRVPLSYDPLIIQEWKDNIIRMVLEEYLTCVATGHWNMNFTSCYKFNKLCEYYKVCSASGAEAKQFALDGYVESSRYDKYEGEGNE